MLLTRGGIHAAFDVFLLIAFELYLALLSLPLYIAMRPEVASAYMEEKGVFGKTVTYYNLRRVLTLTGLSVFLFIGLVKLLLIVAIPSIYAPLNLYTVSQPKTGIVLSAGLVSTQSEIQTSAIDHSMSRPVLKEVRKDQDGNYTFRGSGIPNDMAVVFLSDIQTAVYYDTIDKNGNWTVQHSQKNFKLSQGNHSVLVFHYDSKSHTRSEMSDQQYFKVRLSGFDWLIQHVDSIANWSVVIIIVMGMFLVLLTTE